MATDTPQDLADLADVWDTLHKSRTILLEICDTDATDIVKTRLAREVEFLEKAQAKIAKRLTTGGIGIDKMGGTDSIVMPGAAKLSRVRAGENLSDEQ